MRSTDSIITVLSAAVRRSPKDTDNPQMFRDPTVYRTTQVEGLIGERERPTSRGDATFDRSAASFDSRSGRVRWQNKTDTTIGAQLLTWSGLPICAMNNGAMQTGCSHQHIFITVDISTLADI